MNRFEAAVELNEERFFRRLHIDDDSYASKSARDCVPGLFALLQKNVTVQAWYLEGSGEFVTDIPEVDACKDQVLCLVTLSRQVSDLTAAMSADGEYLEAYLFNDMADAVLFSAADQLNGYLTELFRDRGEPLTQKFFPGENGIPLSLQKHFLDILKERQDLPVEVNSSCMLLPEKALLYAFGADPGNELKPWEHDCSQCDKKECEFRESGKSGAECPR